MAAVDTTAQHVRDAYPTRRPSLVRADRNAMVTYLLITGGPGIVTWL